MTGGQAVGGGPPRAGHTGRRRAGGRAPTAVAESELYRPVASTGPFAGMRFKLQARIADWPLSTKQIDMACVRGGRVHAIELKVRDWKGAFRQAYSNLYTADYSHVGLWYERIPRADHDMFARDGIGLLSVGRSCDVVVRAKRSQKTLQERRRYVLAQCRQESGLYTA